MTETLRVVIAEDNYLVREGVRRLLEDSGQVEVVACVGDALELLDAVRRFSPSAVLTDIRMPPGHHMEGIEAARAIRAEYPRIGVVVLSQHTDESYARALFSDGSAGLGYLLKDRVGDLEDLVRALQEVASGGSVIDPLIIDTLVARQQTRASSPQASLTPRELDVLREMAQGKTNAGIEQALFLSESTVEKHVNAIFTKLGISAAPVHRRVVAVIRLPRELSGSRSSDTIGGQIVMDAADFCRMPGWPVRSPKQLPEHPLHPPTSGPRRQRDCRTGGADRHEQPHTPLPPQCGTP